MIINRAKYTTFPGLLKLTEEKFTGIIWDDFGEDIKLDILKMVNGKVVTEREWKSYLFSNKLQGIIND